VATEIKYCGLTRPDDARLAAELGAAYAGVIFAGGPRMISAEHAAIVFAELPKSVQRVGVFADQSVDEIIRMARIAGLDVLQLHGGANADRIDILRESFGGDIWSVVRVARATLPPRTGQLAHQSDGLLLDAFVDGKLGGTGVTLPWNELASAIDDLRDRTTIVLAGGLNPANVAKAIATLSPDVVDVSSGVEDAPGLKNHDRMRAFRDAVTSASIPT
jgi:phosphoribosylanthranilate isomerase